MSKDSYLFVYISLGETKVKHEISSFAATPRTYNVRGQGGSQRVLMETFGWLT